MSQSPDIPKPPTLSQALDAMRAGRFRFAAEIATQLRRASPNDPAVLLTLGQALARSGEPKSALAPLKKAIAAEKDNPLARYALAHAYDELARTEDAMSEIDSILDRAPGFGLAIQLRCTILRRTGRGQEAWDWLAPQLDSLPQAPQIALAAASVLPSSHSPDAVLARVRGSIMDANTPANNRRSLFYVLAKMLDRSGDYEQAFAAAQSANRLMPPMDLNQHQDLLNRMTPELIASIEPANLDASLACLVCGMPRSGTTLTEQIIAAHPDAATVGESSTLGKIVRSVLLHAEEHSVVPHELTTKFAKQYLKHLRESGLPNGRKATVVVDKMPQNFMYLGIVNRLLPGCRVIRCLRDPRDIALSCYMQDFNLAHPYRSTFESLADEINRHDHAAARWSNETSLPIHTSVLEELTADPDTKARELVAHAGLEFDDACLRFHETGGHVKTASVDQVRSGINTKGHGRWKNYATQLAPLIELLKPILPDSSHPPS